MKVHLREYSSEPIPYLSIVFEMDDGDHFRLNSYNGNAIEISSILIFNRVMFKL